MLPGLLGSNYDEALIWLAGIGPEKVAHVVSGASLGVTSVMILDNFLGRSVNPIENNPKLILIGLIFGASIGLAADHIASS